MVTTKAEDASTEPDAGSGDQDLSEVRRRRAELLESINALELALAAPGRQVLWVERVAAALQELSGGFHDHVVLMEGPNGLNVRLIRRSPRMVHAVDRLTKEHTTLTGLIGELVTLVDQAHGSLDRGESISDDPMPGDSDEVRDRGNELLGALTRHRQRGADLVYEAYSVDIGGQD
jgi:hypothetical protein